MTDENLVLYCYIVSEHLLTITRAWDKFRQYTAKHPDDECGFDWRKLGRSQSKAVFDAHVHSMGSTSSSPMSFVLEVQSITLCLTRKSAA